MTVPLADVEHDEAVEQSKPCGDCQEDICGSQRNFGIVTDIKTSPDDTLYVVALDRGAVYEVSRRRQR